MSFVSEQEATLLGARQIIPCMSDRRARVPCHSRSLIELLGLFIVSTKDLRHDRCAAKAFFLYMSGIARYALS